uniref:Uncharacterized protein n=1 Tax=Arundo donax TaxID=35708 RepID=A0A0A8XXB0_ARUDO
MEGSSLSKQRDREVIRKEVRRIALGLDDDPAAAERRYAGMDERVRDEIWEIRGIFAGMDRACGGSRSARQPGQRIRFRLEGGKLVQETDEGERKEGVVEQPSSSASTAAAGSEDELCSAFGSARF